MVDFLVNSQKPMTNSFKTQLQGNQRLVWYIAVSWLVYWALQPLICTYTVRLAELLLLGLGVSSIDDGKVLMLPYRQLSFAGACAGLGIVLGLSSAAAYFFGRPSGPLVKMVLGLAALPVAVAAQAVRIAAFCYASA